MVLVGKTAVQFRCEKWPRPISLVGKIKVERLKRAEYKSKASMVMLGSTSNSYEADANSIEENGSKIKTNPGDCPDYARLFENKLG